METNCKHESSSQKGLFFWAEMVGGIETCWHVVSQATGFPATEAWGDWFAFQKDADDVAQHACRWATVSPTPAKE